MPGTEHHLILNLASFLCVLWPLNIPSFPPIFLCVSVYQFPTVWPRPGVYDGYINKSREE